MTLARARHILVDNESHCKDLKQQIEQGADFDSLARIYSSCPSAEAGGDLGEIRPGMMLEAFDEVMFKAPLHKVQGPVITQFGFHLLEVTSRKD
jgi:peptidyl-prolyl cis-trans isomerase C